VTRNPLTTDRLSPNRALAEAIGEWKAKMTAEGKKFLDRIEPKPISQGTVLVDLTAFERGSDDRGTHDVLVELDAGKGSGRTGVDVVCVIDISGSMQTEASVADGGESNGLSILDIVKHAVATVIQTLGPQDRIAIVSYSSSARVELELTATTDEGRKVADLKLRALHTEGSTNLWDGLLKGMDVLRSKDREGRIPTVFLLTDGQPNVQPPRGHLQMLQRYKDEHQVNYTINSKRI
jgi:Mg-chelatase subunit ChlD